MNPIKLPNGHYLIPIDMFNTCVIDGLTRSEIAKLYQRKDVTTHKSAYFLDKFAFHIKTKHGIATLKDYCITHLKIEWPKCPHTHVDVTFKVDGKGVRLSQYGQGSVTKQTNPNFAAFCDKMSKDRKGEGNPMYGKDSWSKGLTAETNDSLKQVSLKLTGKKKSAEHIAKASASRRGKPSPTKGKRIHSDERIEWFRSHTARLWQRGVFNRVSSIHIKMREFLNTLSFNQEWTEEYQIGPFAVDFAFPNAKLAIEADGDYYHVNPEFYPNGPENAMQRCNFGRDHAKNQYLAACGWTILRSWEHKINDGSFKEPLICKLKELNLLNG